MFRSQSEVRVRYAETDAMGVVYHANYLTWFEVARVRFLDEVGLPYRELEARGYLLPVLSASLRYRSPARFDDRVQIEMEIGELPQLRLHIDYRIRRSDTLLVTGQTEHVFTDTQGQPLRPPAFFVEALQSFASREPAA
jgi:acyl-CoA thioester hydrolase